MSVLGTLDFGKKVTAIELGRISTQDNGVGVEGEDCLHPFPVVGRDLISRIAQRGDDVFPETIVRLHNQDFPCFLVHNVRFLGWRKTVRGFNLGGGSASVLPRSSWELRGTTDAAPTHRPDAAIWSRAPMREADCGFQARQDQKHPK